MLFEDGKVYTVSEVAGVLRVTNRTVVCWIRDGELDAMKAGRVWRIQGQDINRFLKDETERAMKGDE